MKQRLNYAEAGYADLVPLRIIATIILILALIAIPAYVDNLKRNKLIPVLDALQLGVEEHYKEAGQLPDIEKIAVVAEYGHVEVKDSQIRIKLSGLDKDIADQYLQLQPFLENDNVAWKCTFVGDVYKDDVPDLRDNICRESRLALEERSFAERSWNFIKAISTIIVAYILFIGLTLLFG